MSKKKIVAAISGIVSALHKGYELLREGGELPEVLQKDLPAIGPHIVKALQVRLAEIEDNAQYEGMTYEEMLEKKEAARQEAIKNNLASAGEQLRKLKGVKAEPAENESTDSGEPDPSTESGESDTIDEGEGAENDNSYQTIIAIIGDLETELKDLDTDSERFLEKSNELATFKKALEEMNEALKEA